MHASVHGGVLGIPGFRGFRGVFEGVGLSEFRGFGASPLLHLSQNLYYSGDIILSPAGFYTAETMPEQNGGFILPHAKHAWSCWGSLWQYRRYDGKNANLDRSIDGQTSIFSRLIP
jgi:hypothetical protein